MSDGPHKSLNMRSAWKRLAERADKEAFSPQEVSEALPAALEQDWRAEVPGNVLRRVRAILCNQADTLFGDQTAEQLHEERINAAGHPLANTLVDCAIQAAEQGRYGDGALKEAAGNALFDRAARGVRQVEEHYQRKSSHEHAGHVRGRLESGVNQADIRSLAERLVRAESSQRALAPAKQDGLDDGVEL